VPHLLSINKPWRTAERARRLPARVAHAPGTAHGPLSFLPRTATTTAATAPPPQLYEPQKGDRQRGDAPPSTRHLRLAALGLPLRTYGCDSWWVRNARRLCLPEQTATPASYDGVRRDVARLLHLPVHPPTGGESLAYNSPCHAATPPFTCHTANDTYTAFHRHTRTTCNCTTPSACALTDGWPTTPPRALSHFPHRWRTPCTYHLLRAFHTETTWWTGAGGSGRVDVALGQIGFR